METSRERHIACQRVLARDNASVRSEVVIRLLEPEFAPQDNIGEYRCGFEIDGLDGPIRDYGYGIDSLQALVCANTRATYALWPFRAALQWLDSSYDWNIAHCVQVRDGARRTRLRDINDEEEAACAELMRDLELIRRASMERKRDCAAEREADRAMQPPNAWSPGPAERDAIAQSERCDPVCTRRLTRGFTADVHIKIWRPTPVAGRDGDHLCVFQVLGVGGSAPATTAGVDSIQALFLAMRGVDSLLHPWRDDLRWFDLTYEDPAVFPNVLDAGRQRRVDAIIEEEIYANEQRRRRRQEFHELHERHERQRAHSQDEPLS